MHLLGQRNTFLAQVARWAPPWWRTASADLALAGRAAWYAGRAAAVGIAFPSVELSADSALVWSGAALEALPALGRLSPMYVGFVVEL